MGYRFRRREDVSQGVRRIASEQVEAALELLSDPSLAAEHVVHQVRKHCKKLRALLRLIRAHARNVHRRENRAVRNIARQLAGARDLAVARKAWVKVAQGADETATPPERPSHQPDASPRDDEPLNEERTKLVRSEFRELLNRIPTWRIRGRGFDLLREGFENSYRRARKGMRHAVESGTADDHHEWRKHVKDHWYHLRLLGGVWPEMVRVERNAARDLGELLGEEHDLYVLRERLESGEGLGEWAPTKRERRWALRTLKQTRRKLRRRAREIGERLLVESPRDRGERFARLWATWRPERD